MVNDLDKGLGIVSTTMNPTSIELAVANPNLSVSTEKVIDNGHHGLVQRLVSSYGGIFMAFLASIFFTTSMLIIKVLQDNHSYPASGVAVLFNLGVVLPCVLALFYYAYGPGFARRKRLREDFWPLNNWTNQKILLVLVLQGSLQGFSVVFRSKALGYIPVADMTVIVFSSPILVAILSHFLLRERCALLPTLLTVVTVTGIFLIMKPPLITGESTFDSKTLTGTLFSLGALVSLSLKFVVTRSIKQVNVLTMTLFLGIFGLLISLPWFLVTDNLASVVPSSSTETLLVLGLFLGFASIASINMALKLELATTVALVRSLDVVFAFLFQFVFLGVIPDKLSAIGAVLVVSAVILSAVRKWIEELNPGNEIRRKLKFLLL